MRPDDGGSSRPPLPADAGPNERTLYEVYDFQTGIVDLTASDWRTSAESVRGLSADVRGIVSALRGAPDAWSGPAAEAAYSTLGKLADNLEVHAEEIDRIEAGLTSAYDSAAAARTDYVTKVRSVSLDVDPAGYQRTPASRPAQPVPDGTVLDRQAYDSAVADARAAREKQAAAVLAAFTDSMTTATKKLPVEPADPASVPSGSTTSGGGGAPPGGDGQNPSRPPTGGGSGGGDWTPHDVTGDDDLPADDDTGGTDTGGTDTGGGDDPWPPVVDPPPPVLDGPTDGTTSPGGGTAGPPPGSTGSGVSGGQLNPGGAAAGLGGMLAGGGAAAMFGRGGMPGGAAPVRLPGAAVGGSNGGLSGRSGGTSGAGSTGGTGRSSVLAGGGQGAAGRGSSAGRGSAVRSGRYGVPKLGAASGGRGTVGAAGGAGGRNSSTGERDDAPDVDRLTTEDEQTWFEGAEDATPPVWD